jgi:hypothetical protein
MATLSRRQLYDLVWSKPMRDAAAEIGISDVGLKKVCVRYRVPVPPQGYWNKVHAGQKPAKILFREVSDPQLSRVRIEGSSYNPPPEVKKAIEEAKARESAPEKKIEVAVAPPTLPAAVRLAAALKKNKLAEGNLVSSSDPIAARKQRRAEHERREREWQLRQQREAEAQARAELETARVEFLGERLAAFDEMNRLDRFLARLASAPQSGEPPARFAAFVQWAEQRVQQLRRQWSAEALHETLADSTLFGPNFEPPLPYAWKGT